MEHEKRNGEDSSTIGQKEPNTEINDSVVAERKLDRQPYQKPTLQKKRLKGVAFAATAPPM